MGEGVKECARKDDGDSNCWKRDGLPGRHKEKEKEEEEEEEKSHRHSNNNTSHHATQNPLLQDRRARVIHAPNSVHRSGCSDRICEGA